MKEELRRDKCCLLSWWPIASLPLCTIKYNPTAAEVDGHLKIQLLGCRGGCTSADLTPGLMKLMYISRSNPRADDVGVQQQIQFQG